MEPFYSHFFLFLSEKECKRVKEYLFCIFLCLLGFVKGYASEKDNYSIYGESENADSIIKHVIAASPRYAHIVGEFDADLYVRGRVKVYRRNHLIKAVPSMFRFEKGIRDYIVESMNEIHYTAPDIYDLKVKALTGTLRRNNGEIGNIMEYFNMNIYSSSLLPDKLLSPLDRRGMKRYYYLLDSILGTGDSLRYKILIIPRNKSNQLISGYMIVNDASWTIDELYFTGKVEQVTFKAKVEMGKNGHALYLPKRFDVDMVFNFVGNKIGARYEAVFNYKDIVLSKFQRKSSWKKSKYDLSESFNLSTDSTRTISDTVYMKKVRPYPLTEEECRLYNDFKWRNDTIRLKRKKKSKGAIFFGELGDALISNYTINLSELGSVKCSPLINPFLFGYSKSHGYAYVQKFKYNYLFTNQKLLRISPRLGYNFSDKEFYWRADIDFIYWPQRIGQVSLRIGNGNRIYSSDVLDDLKSLPNTAVNFDKMKLDYFKDDYFILNHKVEISNGFSVEAGVSYHRRTLVDKSNLYNPHLQSQLSGKLRNLYISFAPNIRLEWTPELYYYMNGKRKINFYSRYPTFSIDWERGVKGVLRSIGRYERWEFDMQQEFKLGGMRSLFYRAGCGAFTDQDEMYFVDFVNFTRNSLPVGWNDEIGGVFQLLDRRWYNSSRKYVRGHITYETPFLIFRHVRKYTSIIQNERLYGSVLYVPHLLPYIELGYGVGTHIFDLGIFVSSINGRFETVGCKFTFELFNR